MKLRTTLMAAAITLGMVAASIARKVDGVKAVKNEITVRT